MCNIPLTNKGWLRQYLPQLTMDDLSRFERVFNIRMYGVKNPTTQEINQARLQAYRRLMGVVA